MDQIDQLHFEKYPELADVMERIFKLGDGIPAIDSLGADARIAGGFLSDLYAGVRPKDVDVFVPAHTLEVFRKMISRKSPVLADHLKSLGFCQPSLGSGAIRHRGSYGDVTDVCSLVEMKIILSNNECMPVQLIGVNSSPACIINRFDLNCRRMSIGSSMLERGKFNMLDSAKRDFDNGEITVNCLHTPHRTIGRIQRIGKKLGLKVGEDTMRMLEACLPDMMQNLPEDGTLDTFYELVDDPFYGPVHELKKRRIPAIKSISASVIRNMGEGSVDAFRLSVNRLEHGTGHVLDRCVGEYDVSNLADALSFGMMDSMCDVIDMIDELHAMKDRAGLPSKEIETVRDMACHLLDVLAGNGEQCILANCLPAEKSGKYPAKLGRYLKKMDHLVHSVWERRAKTDRSISLPSRVFDSVSAARQMLSRMLKVLKHLPLIRSGSCIVRISDRPEDIYGISMDKPWTSCANADAHSGAYAAGRLPAIMDKGFAAYAVDRETGKTVARSVLWPCMDGQGVMIDKSYAADSAYGHMAPLLFRHLVSNLLAQEGAYLAKVKGVSMPLRWFPYSDRFGTISASNDSEQVFHLYTRDLDCSKVDAYLKTGTFGETQEENSASVAPNDDLVLEIPF